MDCPLHFHLSSPAFPFPLPLLGSKFFQGSAEMFSVKHSQELSYPWAKWSLCAPTKSFPLSQWCWSEDFWFLPSCCSLLLYSSASGLRFLPFDLNNLFSSKNKQGTWNINFSFLHVGAFSPTCTILSKARNYLFSFFLKKALFLQNWSSLKYSTHCKTFFIMAMTWLCHTSSAFLSMYCFLYLPLCLFFSEISKFTFLRY